MFERWMSGKTEAEVAQRLGFSKSIIGKWKRGEKPISAYAAAHIEDRTCGELTREQLRPDVFGPLPYQRAQ